jgi:hypothetical protein
MDKPVYMKCGHATYATLEPEGAPICTTCLCLETAEKPDVSGREAHCSLCGHITKSTFVQDNPFFRYRADQPHDTYYDWCEGYE